MFAVCNLQCAYFEIPLQPPSERISYTTDRFVLLANYSNDWTSPHLILPLYHNVPDASARFPGVSTTIASAAVAGALSPPCLQIEYYYLETCHPALQSANSDLFSDLSHFFP
jgi:hypothetical protein